MIHQSDCEVHNEPAYPKGHCTCGADIAIRDCRCCIHKPICRLWYSEVELVFAGEVIHITSPQPCHLDMLDEINEKLAKDCKLWRER